MSNRNTAWMQSSGILLRLRISYQLIVRFCDAKKRIIKSEILGECYLKKAKFESDLNLYNRINTIEIIISISVRLGHLVLIF